MKPTKVAGIAILMLLVFLAATIHNAAAQTTNSQTTAQTTNPQTTAQTTNSQTTAQTTNAQATAGVQPRVIGLDGHLEADVLIKVEIDHLAEWAATPKNDPGKLVPYLNGLALVGNYPEEIHASENHLHYHLRITSENKKVWIDLLGAPKGIRRLVTFSVGLEGQSPFDSDFHPQDKRFPLTVISPVYGVIALILVLATLFLLVGLARTTNIIREPGPKPAGGKRRPYNLGRTQMAFWFFLVYASYITIWLITNALDTITASLLGLIGISAGTALSEAMIDSGKDTAKAGQLQDLTAEKQALEQSVPELQSQVAAVNAKDAMTPDDLTNRDSLSKQLQDSRTRLALVNQQIQVLTPPASTGISAGFLRDILSDASGYSFHRFQIFAWTLVLGVIFVSSVYNELTMPEFSTTLLGLMGISSGTYIGFKFPEEK